MKISNGNDLKAARRSLDWSLSDMAAALRLAENSGRDTIRKMESGKINISGPITVAVEAFLAGYIPEDFYDDQAEPADCAAANPGRF